MAHVSKSSIVFKILSFSSSLFGGAEELARLLHPASIQTASKVCVYVNSCLLVMLSQPRTKHRLPHWIVGAISLAHTSDGLQLAHRVGVHSSMGMAPSWAFFKGVFVSDTCPVASWSSPRTFVQFYLLDATAPLVAPSVPSQQYTSALRRDSSLVVALPGGIACCTERMD